MLCTKVSSSSTRNPTACAPRTGESTRFSRYVNTSPASRSGQPRRSWPSSLRGDAGRLRSSVRWPLPAGSDRADPRTLRNGPRQLAVCGTRQPYTVPRGAMRWSQRDVHRLAVQHGSALPAGRFLRRLAATVPVLAPSSDSDAHARHRSLRIGGPGPASAGVYGSRSARSPWTQAAWQGAAEPGRVPGNPPATARLAAVLRPRAIITRAILTGGCPRRIG